MAACDVSCISIMGSYVVLESSSDDPSICWILEAWLARRQTPVTKHAYTHIYLHALGCQNSCFQVQARERRSLMKCHKIEEDPTCLHEPDEIMASISEESRLTRDSFGVPAHDSFIDSS